jgi:micrococcal nuclease
MTPTRGLYLTVLFLLLALMPAPASAQTQAGPAYVTRVVDGVTLYADVAGRIEVVRYLGVRVPRIDDPNYGNSPYAASAREANRRLVEGRWIWLLFDREPRDAQGRLRAWVWRDALFVNGALVYGGWAVGAATDPQLAEYFATFESGARQGGRGLWRSPRSIAYYQPQPITLGDGDTDGSDGVDTRVFSAPAPFPPPQSSAPGRTSAPSAAAAPTPSVPSSSMSGGAGYSTPSRSTGSSRTVK